MINKKEKKKKKTKAFRINTLYFRSNILMIPRKLNHIDMDSKHAKCREMIDSIVTKS